MRRYRTFFEEFKGIKSVAKIKTRKKNPITLERDEIGDTEASRKGIADTSATCYEDQYSSRNRE